MIKKIVMLSVFGSLLLTSGCGPQSYEDCIIDSMSGVGSDLAAKSIRMSCRDKFRDDTNDTNMDAIQLQPSEINRINGTPSKTSAGNPISMIAYNGNRCITVKSLIISISNSTGTKQYKIDTAISPLSVEQVFFDIAMGGNNDAGYSTIVSGTGEKVSGDCAESAVTQPNASDEFFNQDFSKFGQAK